MSQQYRVPAGRAAEYARRGHNRRPANVYRIEGESLTLAEIAERLGVSARRASERMRRARERPGAVKWEWLA